ncbi:dicarboxylate/amino acid:cation symporter [Sphingomonas sp. dw_22]|uniref:dicarboxylate/amino acid:cation symporter n=1 Tax=Sphingomonas sp. dw_22 TaxID=2721175 RepID=UPI002116CD0C|nr:dicarboxylate/amino acid:cation symporter [Sphingomonas sp. dw_22]
MTPVPAARPSAPAMRGRWRVPAHIQNFLGLAIGLGGGLAVNIWAPGAPWVAGFTEQVTRPIGELFLRLLFILALPLLFSAIVSGVGGVRDLETLRRIGGRTLALTVAGSVLAALIGLAAANLFRPGDGVDQATAQNLLASARGTQSIVAAGDNAPIGLNMVVRLIPADIVSAASQGNVLGVIFLAALLGIGLVLVRTDATARLLAAIEGLFEIGIRLLGIVILFTPIAAACLVFNLAVLFGWDLLSHLGAYVSVVLFALLLYMGVVLSSAVWMLGGLNPLVFFRGVQEAAFIAFCTGSSQATLPTALKAAEERLKLPSRVARFVLGVGTSGNQSGTAVYQSVTALFLAQVLGVQLGAGQQLSVLAVCVLGGIGTAGVPAGSLPVVAMILGMVDIPPSAIGIVIGVDRLLDMCRTTLNVVSDLALAVIVTREG